MGQSTEVAVVGGGVVGCSIAYHLALEGIQVTVLEQGQIGGAASSAAAGILAPLAEAHADNPFATLALAGCGLFERLAGELREASGIDIGYSRSGVLRLASNEAEASALKERQSWQAGFGYPLEWLNPAAIWDLEPAVSREIVGGLHSPNEGSVDAPRLVQAYARAAARAGASFRQGASVLGFERDGGRATALRLHDGRIAFDRVVLAAGPWTARWTAELGVPIPVFPVRGQVIAVGGLSTGIRHVLYFGKNYLVPKPDGTLILGATQEDAGFDSRNTLGGLTYLAGGGQRIAPALADATFLRAWSGLRPGSADGLPLLGPVPGRPEVLLATGHFRNGILLSGITGRIIADLICHGSTEFDLTAFRPDRFAAVSAEC